MSDECGYSRKAHYMIANNSPGGTEEDNRTLCIPRNYSQEINFSANDSLPINDFQREFILEAEKQIQNLELISRKEKELLLKIQNNLPQEAKYAVHRVKTSMQYMHAKYAKQLDVKLNELTSILTRVEHLHEEMQDFKQWEQTDEERLAKIDLFLRTSIQEKEMIEANIEETVRDLNVKRQNDERLFSEFAKSINQQVQVSLKGLSECIHNAEMRRKARVDAKVAELKLVLQDLKKFG
ncbi:hypothetical protein JTE90_002428 [Oedothorax gibbosus]|uniref:Uncharacterized protein n=1 Tax=Oedothorax gibbosus TaxID=931172 RepID=A0AAV6UVQ3_9ARAC|nr:hypothetical protein JTE90_002428 [Oedothorax gibbosus]